MTISEKIYAFANWGNAIAAMLDELESKDEHTGNQLDLAIRKAGQQNQWFSELQVKKALSEIVKMLEKPALEKWLAPYKNEIDQKKSQKRIGVIMAGNIPAVGFHDALSVLACGDILLARCASDDKVLIPFLLEVLQQVEPRFKDQIIVTERIEKPDAVIATGSNNSARYFDYYFGKYPHIIRKNRNSIAVLDGTESEEQLENLADDIFTYYGLGCRNISKIYVPQTYDFAKFFPAMMKYNELLNHNKYMNNYDYHNALFLLNSEPFLTNNFLIVREHKAMATPVSVLHYERYDDYSKLNDELSLEKENIQCRVGKGGMDFGKTQQPALNDYADGVDTMKFLMSLN